MAFASHLGAWLLGTVKNTTGTTAGTIRNMGAATVTQSKLVASTDGSASLAFVLPAGAQLLRLDLVQSGATFTSGTSGTFTAYNNGTSIGAVTITTGTAGTLAITPSTQAQAALWVNVGPTDALITYTPATLNAGSGVLYALYVVRNSDGTYAPTSYTA